METKGTASTRSRDEWTKLILSSKSEDRHQAMKALADRGYTAKDVINWSVEERVNAILYTPVQITPKSFRSVKPKSQDSHKSSKPFSPRRRRATRRPVYYTEAERARARDLRQVISRGNSLAMHMGYLPIDIPQSDVERSLEWWPVIDR